MRATFSLLHLMVTNASFLKTATSNIVPVPPQSPLHSFFHCDMAMGLDGNVDMVIHIFHLSDNKCRRVVSPLYQLDSIPTKFTSHSHSHAARLLYFNRSGNLCHHRYVHMFLHRNMEDLILRLEPTMLWIALVWLYHSVEVKNSRNQSLIIGRTSAKDSKRFWQSFHFDSFLVSLHS